MTDYTDDRRTCRAPAVAGVVSLAFALTAHDMVISFIGIRGVIVGFRLGSEE